MLRVFENSVLRRIFGPKRDEVTWKWRKLNNRELGDLYSSLNSVRVIKSRRMRWTGHVARVGEGRGVYWGLLWKPEVKRPLGRPRRRWENNIKMDLLIVGCVGMDWIKLTQDWGQVAGTCECGNEPSVSIKCGEFLDYLRTG